MSAEQYTQIFNRERLNTYPEVDDFENRYGHAVDRTFLESAARVLACPLKVNPPNWQHGRIVFAAALRRAHADKQGIFLDIGTAKGFSACMMARAIARSGNLRKIVSIDVIDPFDKIQRNSVAELGHPMNVYEFVKPFMEPHVEVELLGYGSKIWLNDAVRRHERIAFAFVDGKHSYETVSMEAYRISQMQKPGDVVVFDDLQIGPVNRAVRTATGYDMEYVNAGPRKYAIGVRK